MVPAAMVRAGVDAAVKGTVAAAHETGRMAKMAIQVTMAMADGKAAGDEAVLAGAGVAVAAAEAEAALATSVGKGAEAVVVVALVAVVKVAAQAAADSVGKGERREVADDDSYLPSWKDIALRCHAPGVDSRPGAFNRSACHYWHGARHVLADV
jgi:hypothetical protein